MLAISSTLKSVLEKTLPLTVGLFAIMSVQLIDAVFIGKLGVNELTVQGITMPFKLYLSAFKSASVSRQHRSFLMLLVQMTHDELPIRLHLHCLLAALLSHLLELHCG